MKQNIDNWKENFDKEFGDYDVEGLFWRDTEQYKIVIDFIYTHKKQWEEEAVQAERERINKIVQRQIDISPEPSSELEKAKDIQNDILFPR